MRRAAPAEGVDVGLHCVGLDALLAHLGLEEGRVVDTLGAREDLLAAHEEVVRVRVVLKWMPASLVSKGRSAAVCPSWTHRVDRVGHRVERPDGERELVEDEVVGVVLLPDEPAQPLLVGRPRSTSAEVISRLAPAACSVGRGERTRGRQSRRAGCPPRRSHRPRGAWRSPRGTGGGPSCPE